MTAMEEIRNVLLHVVALHEAHGCNESKPGQTCVSFRANAIAFFAHSLGFDPVTFREQPAKVLEDYHQRHVAARGRCCVGEGP